MVNAEANPSAVPPKRTFSALSKQSRRSDPLTSKSLPRSKKVKIASNSDGSREKTKTGDSPQVATLPVEKSQESSSDQSATKWFDRVNQNVVETKESLSKDQAESPFYLAHHSDQKIPARLRSKNGDSFAGRQRTETENEDLRDVIDDLTIENKRLKHLLKRAPRRNSTHKPTPDKILEIRMHGLPTEKKRELEQLLKKFTLGLNSPSTSQPSSSAAFETTHDPTSQSSLVAQTHPTTGVDSGYASITTSALNMATPTGNGKPPGSISQSHRDTSIKNYLHDIPYSFLPKGTPSLDEDSKMKLVVQRLEQLFLGKSAVPGEHSLPVQQQKISRSAARADRRDDIKHNRLLKGEGSREARMLPWDTRLTLDAAEHDLQPEQTSAKEKTQRSSGSTSDAAGSASDNINSPNQRPTRPLDLDIQRAQVVEDNIRYIRHLGFHAHESEEWDGPKEQPWIYLNLLVSMAQLHIFNVTPDFVRKAVRKLSTRFEVSKDEQKIRWTGETAPPDVGDLQGGSGGCSQRTLETGSEENGRRSGRSATSTLNEQSSMSTLGENLRDSVQSTSQISSHPRELPSGASSHPSKSSAFGYKPIVFQGRRAARHSSFPYLESQSSPDSETPDYHSHQHISRRPSLKAKEDYRDGILTFFSNPYYHADLSGDAEPVTHKQSRMDLGDSEVLGMTESQDFGQDNVRDFQARYFTCVPDELEAGYRAEKDNLCIPDFPISHSGEHETQPLELPASGIGGVKPEDNFALDVKVARFRKPADPQSRTSRRIALTGHQQPTCFDYRVAGCERLTLQPSRLPSPSYVFFTSSSASSDGQGDSSDDSSGGSSECDDDFPAPADFMWQWTSSSQENIADEAEDSDTSSSIGEDGAGRTRARSTERVGGYRASQPAGAINGSVAATVGASASVLSAADQHDTAPVHTEMELD